MPPVWLSLSARTSGDRKEQKMNKLHEYLHLCDGALGHGSCCKITENVEKLLHTYSMAISYLRERAIMDYGEDRNNICI
jgi:hypothetical protein